jgi:serine/threonine protein kinase
VHRDIKPSNILVTPQLQCLVFDFGIAKPLERRDPVTGKGLIIGTPEYMSPEQCQGGPIDHRTDIYSLGILAYELFTGDVPFSGETAVSILMRHVTEPLPKPSKELALPPALIRVLERATAPSPDDRYASAREMGRAILRAAEGSPTVTVRSKALGETMSRWRRRAPRISGRAALFFFSALALGVAGTIVVERRLPATPAPPPVRQTQARAATDLSVRPAPPTGSQASGERPFIPPRENRVFEKSTEPSSGPNGPTREDQGERSAGVGTPVFDPAPTNAMDLEPPRRWKGFLTDSNCEEKGGQQGALHVRCAERCIREGAQPMLYSRGKLYRIEGFSNITVSRGEPITFKGWLNSQTNTITVASN